MRALSDTHIFLWYLDDSPHLTQTARDFLSDTRNTIYVSIVSAWEISIKVGIGKLRLSQDVVSLFEEELEKNGFELLPVELRHVAPIAILPLHHRDPFDRLLIAQSLVEKMAIISADSAFDAYEGLVRIW